MFYYHLVLVQITVMYVFVKKKKVV